MRRVAAEAEVSLAGIYHYVAGKDELLYWIQYHTFDSLLEGLVASIDGITDPRERLAAAIRVTSATLARTWRSSRSVRAS